MEQGYAYIPSTSSYASYAVETKSDIIAFAVGNPVNKSKAKLSKNNQNLLGYDIADLLITRHNHELQRCKQFYSLATIYEETSTKDKHRIGIKHLKKMYSAGRKYILRLFVCFGK